MKKELDQLLKEHTPEEIIDAVAVLVSEKEQKKAAEKEKEALKEDMAVMIDAIHNFLTKWYAEDYDGSLAEGKIDDSFVKLFDTMIKPTIRVMSNDVSHSNKILKFLGF